MVIYWFNGDKAYEVVKIYPIEVEGHYNRYRARINKEDDPRKYSNGHNGISWIDLSWHEGEIRYRCFWLKDEDDERAIRIIENYNDELLKKKQKELEKIKKKIGIV